MSLDIATLLSLNAAGILALGALLVLYRAYLKTYAGFDLWIAGTFAIGVGLIVNFSRGKLPLALCVLAGNLLLALGVTLRLDGAIRFLRGTPAPRLLYGGPLAVLAASAWFLFARDDIALRTLALFGWGVATLLLIARELLRAAPPARPGLHRGVAALFATVAALAASRALFLCLRADYDYLHPAHPTVHALFFTANIALDFVCWLGFLLLTAQRVEEELSATRDRAVAALDRLDSLHDEAGKLGALLPMCMHCRRTRDEAGIWTETERFLAARSTARFLDSTCPSCRAAGGGGGRAAEGGA